MPSELPALRQVGGCVQIDGIIDLLFLDGADVLPIRLVTKCQQKLTKICASDKCMRYRTGTAGSHRISWRNAGARV